MEKQKTGELLQEARELIREKKFEDARALLVTIDDPQADKLMERLNAANLQGDSSSGGQSETNGIVLLLVCFFLGFLGLHRFMTGHILIGVLQLLTGGGFGIWWIIDIVLIATGNYKDKQGNPVKLTS